MNQRGATDATLHEQRSCAQRSGACTQWQRSLRAAATASATLLESPSALYCRALEKQINAFLIQAGLVQREQASEGVPQ